MNKYFINLKNYYYQKSLLRGSILPRHCEEMRSIDAAIQEKIAKNAMKTIVFSRLPRRYAPRNDGLSIHATMPSGNNIPEARITS